MAVAFRSESHDLANSTSATGTEPAGAASGDFILGLYVVNSPGSISTIPAGWTAIINNDLSANGGFFLSLAYLIRGGSAPSYAFTHTGSTYRELWLAAYSGVDGTTPLDVTPPTFVETSNTTTKPDPPASGASVTANAMALAVMNMWGNSPAGGGWTAQAGYTLRWGSVGGCTGAMAEKALTSAGTNEDPGVFGGTPQSADDGLATTLLLRPAAGAVWPPVDNPAAPPLRVARSNLRLG